jgi:hypothetical protein
MIDKNKTYTTRDGCEVRIYAVDGGGSDHIHGAVKSVYGCWIAEQWYSGGKYAYCGVHMKDLIEVRPRIKREVWVNVYPHIGVGQFHLSKAQADMNADVENRIACVKLTIDCEEGEGLTDDPR